jgi:hypothetical protein
MKEIKFLFTFFKNNQFNIHIDLFMSSKEFIDHFNDSDVDFREILFSGNLELLRKYLCDNCSSTRSIWHSSESLNNVGEFLFQMEKEGYESTCLINIPVLREKGKEVSEGIVYGIYIKEGYDSGISFNITSGLPLDCVVYGRELYPVERITKKKLINIISRLFLNDKGILESKDNFGYKGILMNVLINKKYIRSIVTDYKKIYHSRTIRDLIENGTINTDKSNFIKYITSAYDNNDKLKFGTTLIYIDGLDAKKYRMEYIISGSRSIDDKIKDCDLLIVKERLNAVTITNEGGIVKREGKYEEDIIYENKVSYKEFIKSIKEVSLI